MTNQEINILVAEKVVGWIWTKFPVEDARKEVRRPYPPNDWYAKNSERAIGNESLAIGWDSELPPYSTNASVAFTALDALGKQLNKMEWELYGGYTPKVECQINWKLPSGEEDNVWAVGNSIPLAICLAALKAVGITIEEINYETQIRHSPNPH